ncbi:MAG: phosphate ABC transporter permease PstA [Rhizobiales bacterium]|nr:phosphate ABC transporter permease PstA [Hyphomicrobiales bacterium]NRB14353.1 phosphate ABC transporter permease PstA [Hyphomicrobiales bacterium]
MIDKMSRHTKKRYQAERRFKIYGLLAIMFALGFLGLMLSTIALRAIPAFTQTYIQLTVEFSAKILDVDNKRDVKQIARADFQKIIREALYAEFPAANKRQDKKHLKKLVSSEAGYHLSRDLLAAETTDLNFIGTSAAIWVKSSDDVDSFIKDFISREVDEINRRLNDQQIGWIDSLIADGKLETRFNWDFFKFADSRSPEDAGIRGAVMGSLFTLAITLMLSFPLGVFAAIYLEEYAKPGRITDFIGVNINNLAAIPSIVFGLLGLALFLNIFGMSRSSPLVGGLVLSLMTLPTVIITTRAALKSVPPSIREAALGIGASKMQTILHHVLPLAMPGALTGAIIGMARALGETAPLLMIGMVAFIADIPTNINDPATVLPVQIYIWADSPERAFESKMSAAILVLLFFLIVMNGLAVLLRRKYERRW